MNNKLTKVLVSVTFLLGASFYPSFANAQETGEAREARAAGLVSRIRSIKEQLPLVKDSSVFRVSADETLLQAAKADRENPKLADYLLDNISLNFDNSSYCVASKFSAKTKEIYFWTYHYSRRVALGSGEDVCVFINAMTGEVIGYNLFA